MRLSYVAVQIRRSEILPESAQYQPLFHLILKWAPKLWLILRSLGCIRPLLREQTHQKLPHLLLMSQSEIWKRWTFSDFRFEWNHYTRTSRRFSKIDDSKLFMITGRPLSVETDWLSIIALTICHKSCLVRVVSIELIVSTLANGAVAKILFRKIKARIQFQVDEGYLWGCSSNGRAPA